MLLLTLEHLLAQGQVCCHHWCRQQSSCCDNSSESASGELLHQAAVRIAADCLDLNLTPAAGLCSNLRSVPVNEVVPCECANSASIQQTFAVTINIHIM